MFIPKKLIFIAGAVFGIGLAVLAVGVWQASGAPAYAAVNEPARSGPPNPPIMVAGTLTGGNACVWVLDTRQTEDSPCLALYVANGVGNMRLASVRRIKYDLQLISYNDQTEQSMSVQNIKKQIEEIEEKSTKQK